MRAASPRRAGLVGVGSPGRRRVSPRRVRDAPARRSRGRRGRLRGRRGDLVHLVHLVVRAPPARRERAPPRGAPPRGGPRPSERAAVVAAGVPHHRPRGGGGAVHPPGLLPGLQRHPPRGAAGRRRRRRGRPSRIRAGRIVARERHVRVEAGRARGNGAIGPAGGDRALREGTRGGFFRRRFFGLIIIISLGPGLRRVVVRLPPRTRSPPPGRHPAPAGARGARRRGGAIRRRVRGAVRPDRVLLRRQPRAHDEPSDDPARAPPEESRLAERQYAYANDEGAVRAKARERERERERERLRSLEKATEGGHDQYRFA